MTFDFVFIPTGESPPPYSAVAASSPESPEPPSTALPFDHSDQLATEIRALVSEGATLCVRFKDVHDVASSTMSSKFEYREPALRLSQTFEELIWESRRIAGVALVAVKDFDEIILDFLAERDATVQDRLKELSHASKLLQGERDSAAKHKSSFDALVKELEGFRLMVSSESGTLRPGLRRQSHSGRRATRGSARSSRKPKPKSINVQPYVVPPRSELMSGLSTVTASLGAIPRTCMDYATQFGRVAEKGLFPWCRADSQPDGKEAGPTAAPDAHAHAETTGLSGLVDALLHDVRVFVDRANVFSRVLTELARAQDIFIVYLKDGQSVANRAYKFEIDRLRKHLPGVYGALDAYSKAKHS